MRGARQGRPLRAFQGRERGASHVAHAAPVLAAACTAPGLRLSACGGSGSSLCAGGARAPLQPASGPRQRNPAEARQTRAPASLDLAGSRVAGNPPIGASKP